MTLSLRDRLLRWLRNNPGYHASGDLQKLVAETTTYTPSNVSRRLRELENEKLIQVRYVKNHAHYRAGLTVDQLWASIPDAREVASSSNTSQP